MGNSQILILEINEINLEVLKSAATNLNLRHLQKILSYTLTHTTTDDRYESDFLEPWVQWVSIHTGRPSSDHHIKHLGDVPNLAYSQIWEDVDQLGMSTGIFGVMNGARRRNGNCKFFLPDPWTFSESAYPAELNEALEFPRYIARDYLNLSKTQILKLLSKFLIAVYRMEALAPTLRILARLPLRILKFGLKPFVFISSFDELMGEIFARYHQKYQPDFSIFFLNSLAHLQHHHWTEELPKFSRPMAFGMKILDKVVGKVLENFQAQDLIVVLNGLSQKRSIQNETWILYRQISPTRFLKDVGITHARLEPLMTHDAHIFFSNSLDASNAFDLLTQATINHHPLFLVEQDPLDKLKLFYRIRFVDPVTATIKFKIGSQIFLFSEYFTAVTLRSGSHIPGGFLLSKGIEFPNKIYNHEIKAGVLNAIDSRASTQ